jgi:DNA-binding transcriptional LysR family regulator
VFKENRLRTFRAVVQEGSLSRAAWRVHVSQSTASLHLRELEDELGVVVLDRSPEGARPTPAGEALAE